MTGRARLRLFIAPLTLGSLVVLASCFAATEVTVALSTDLGCTTRVRTAVYKGSRGQFPNEPETETELCTHGAADSQIGTLVFVPSGSRSGTASVKAVLARGGKPPAACTDQSPEDCIFATRSFSYVAHTSRKLPIRLLATCLGKKACPEGQTCGPSGDCISDRVTCAGEECGITPPTLGDGGTPKEDGGGTLPDGGSNSGSCGGSSGVLVDDAPMPPLAADSATTLFWVEPSKQVNGGFAVWKIPKTGGTPSELTVVGNLVAPQRITALGSSKDIVLVGWGQNPSFALKLVSSNGTADDSPPITEPLGALHGNGNVHFAAGSANIFRYEGGAFHSAGLASKAKSITSADDLFLAAADDGLYARDLKDGDAVSFTRLGGDSPNNALVTSSGTELFAAGPLPAGGYAVFSVSKTAALPFANLDDMPSSIAADKSSVYVAIRNSIFSYPKGNGNGTELTSVNAPVRHISLDDTCVFYWAAVQGTVGAPVRAQLRAMKKPASSNPSTGQQ
jgi:hypothetical protein